MKKLYYVQNKDNTLMYTISAKNYALAIKQNVILEFKKEIDNNIELNIIVLNNGITMELYPNFKGK